MALLVPVILFLLAFYAVLMLLYSFKWFRHRANKRKFQSVKISIVVPARNEGRNIRFFLESVRDLEYDGYIELIVVDDQSTDDTANVVTSYFPSIPFLRLVKIEEGVSSKKYALSKGIQNATGQLILTSDADCILPKYLLTEIASAYNSKKAKMIIAPVMIEPGKNFLSIFQSLDFLALQAITLTGVHQLCNGANLTFEKSSFNQVNGYHGIDDIASGDDVLLLGKFNKAFQNEVFILRSKNAIVRTKAVSNLGEFIDQRVRWSGKWKRLPLKDIGILGGVYLLNALIVILFIFSFFAEKIVLGSLSTSPFLFILAVICIKCFFELLLMIPASRFFGLSRFMAMFPLLQPIHIFYTFITGTLALKGNYSWKDRKRNEPA